MNVTVNYLMKCHVNAINEILRDQGVKEIKSFEYNEGNWALFGAFVDQKLVGIVGLYLYNRLPCKDYPNGLVAEIGSLYVKHEYRKNGIATKLVEKAVNFAKVSSLYIDAIVCDSTDIGSEIANKFGFIESTEYRQWLQL